MTQFHARSNLPTKTNNATAAEIQFGKPLSSGGFKNAYPGKYTQGTRAGQECVAKEWKSGPVYRDSDFEQEMSVISCAQGVIDDWARAGIINQRILLNRPQIWNCREKGTKMLVEPMIKNYEKFNSNNGWVFKAVDPWSEAIQALSHFSYHNSGGKLLLCDLQGGSYQDGFILTDPAIVSQAKTYGPTDLGPDGIRSFFSRHRCGRFCKSEWQKPSYQGTPLLPESKHTSFVSGYLPRRLDRDLLSEMQE
ncbi:kinase-like domain-containing protein [Xylaria telfairii]|nr:kinase-like domain-containing protein [Xylaria telfairii]